MKIIKHLLVVVAFSCSHCGFATDYYVDAVNGNDVNDGLAVGEGHAMESFAALFAKYTITSGDKVHVAAGIYTNGVMTKSSAKYRLDVPAGVEIIGAGRDATFIEGQAHTNELGETTLNASPWGCGANAIRGVSLGQGAILRKVTVRKGYAVNYSDSVGGGVCNPKAQNPSLSNGGYVVDCTITGCAAFRGAGISYTTAVRCSFSGNRSDTGADVFQGRAFNCLFGDTADGADYNVYKGGPYVNNTFYGSGLCAHTSSSSGIMLYNSAIMKLPKSNVHCTNSITSVNGIVLKNSSKVGSEAAVKLDANYRPLRTSPCVEKGSSEDYFAMFPAALESEKNLDFWGNPRVVGSSIDAGACESRFGAGIAVTWYVDKTKGSDANDGLSENTAFQSLTHALSNSELISNDTVRVAAGVYSDGEMTSNSRKFRAVVKGGVTLLGAGADVTVIEGADDRVNGTEANHWCGPNAVSCVRLNSGSMVRGFTLRNGHSPANDNSKPGGAVFAEGTDNAAYVVDCVITNNFAGYGAGLYYGTAIRCRFSGNGSSTSLRGSDMLFGRAWNCELGDIAAGECNIYNPEWIVNCVFHGTGNVSYRAGDDYNTDIRNSIVLKYAGRHMKLINCATSNYASTRDEDTLYMTEAEMMLEGYAPKKGSPLIDRGKVEYYDVLPVAVAEALAKTDLAGGQRVYNGRIDIGAYEYDWRDDFAKVLKRSQVEVVSASAAVVTNGTRSLTVPTDASIEIDWSVKHDGQHSFYVVAEGEDSVSVTCGGEALAPADDGQCAFIGVKGETRRIVISCSNGASAVLRDFRDTSGFVISFK